MKVEETSFGDKTIYILTPDQGKEFLPVNDFDTEKGYIRVVEVIKPTLSTISS